MADTKISELDAITTLDGTEEFVVADGGTTKKITSANVSAQLGDWDETIVKQVTESVSGSTTLQDDDELFFAVTGGVGYYFELLLYYDDPNNTADDIKHAFAVAAGTIPRSWRQHFGLGPTTAVAQSGLIADMSTAIVNATGTGVFVVHVFGFFVTSTTTTMTFQWAQNTSDVNAIRVLAGSLLRYRQMA